MLPWNVTLECVNEMNNIYPQKNQMGVIMSFFPELNIQVKTAYYNDKKFTDQTLKAWKNILSLNILWKQHWYLENSYAIKILS